MGKEKRGLEPRSVEDGQPNRKRPKVPALASVIVEALKMDSLQRLCSSFEPILRRVVSEEVERALAKMGSAKLTGRTSPKKLQGPNQRNLQLQFRSRLSVHIFTGGKVEGERGAAIHVVLVDANTGCVVTTGPESSAKLVVVVLEGDFNNEDDEGWTQEDFESHVVKEREGKRPLLTGDLQVSLKEGVGTLGGLTFTDNSSWIRSRKFRLGLKVTEGYCDGMRVREAKSDAFTVKDHRGELYKKHYPPALIDEVWRLEKIGKDGSFHKRLNKAGIYTVEEFLRLVVRDPRRLRNVLGSGMSNKMWEILVEHAKTCVLSGKLYVYYQGDARNIGVVFNNIYELRGLIADEQYYSVETLNESQKVYVDTLVKKAYDNWMHVVEYDGRELVNLRDCRRTSSLRSADPVTMVDYTPSFNQLVSLPQLPLSVSPEQASGYLQHNVGGNSLPSGYVENSAVRCQASAQHVAPNAQLQYEISSFTPQSQLLTSSNLDQMTRNDNMSLALGQPQSSSLNIQSVAGSSGQPLTNLHSYDEWSRQRDGRGIDDYISEEEIRMRSHEMLENEDMQNLLRFFSVGGSAVNVSDDGYAFPSFMSAPTPNFSFDEDRSPSSGKAVVGWLKLKAVLRWGIFIRKQAAEKRAKLVELDD